MRPVNGTIAFTSEIPSIPTNYVSTNRGNNQAIATAGYWAAMTTGSGISSDWWHILSMDWTGNDVNNWISQLAIPTQNRQAVYYRSNNGSNISTSSWTRLANASEAASAQSRANASIPFGGITTVTASSGTFNISANSTANVDVTVVVNDARFKPVIAFYTSNNKSGRLIFAGKPVSIPDSNNKCSFQIANQSSSSYTGVVINVTALCVQKSN